MARAKAPPPFIYTLEPPQVGTFSWDGSKGMAIYIWRSKTLHREIIPLEPTEYRKRGYLYKYYVFAETVADDDGTRGWLLEVEPRPNEKGCWIGYYYNDVEATSFAIARKSVGPPILSRGLPRLS